MSDPAIEAVQRAEAENDGWPWDTTRGAMIQAVREALKPLREIHTPRPVETADGRRWVECEECYESTWPCRTAEVVYAAEELSSGSGAPTTDTESEV